MNDLTGMRFGNRVVLSRFDKTPSREWRYKCVCDCGREDIVRGSSLRNGTANGCLECSAARTKNRTTHGISKTRIYSIWKGMMSRCHSPNAPAYDGYGKIGITVCEQWRDPVVFYGWAIENGYDCHLTIDRIDPKKGYSPDNCRWATWKEQTENVRTLSKANRSGYRGVSKKTGRDVWLARIRVDGSVIHLGHYKNRIDAAKAYDNYVITSDIKRPLNFPYEVEARAAETK